MLALVELMTQYREDDRIEGMLLQRISFFGDYDTVLDVHPFRNDLACRVVKPHRFVLSRGDAAGFTVHPKYKERGHRIRVVDTGLDVFHYCDVRPPAVSAQFQAEKNKFWTDEAQPADYYQKIPRSFLARFRGSHPAADARAHRGLRPAARSGVAALAHDADGKGAPAAMALEADRPVRLCGGVGPQQPEDRGQPPHGQAASRHRLIGRQN